MLDQRFEFGPFVLDSSGVLLKAGKLVPIGTRALALLLTLLRANGQVVTRNQLIDAAWPDASIEDSNLTVQIAALRKVLGESPNGHPWIVTVPRTGYRFIGASASHGSDRRDDASESTDTQEIGYCRAGDGVRLAYAVSGRGPPLVKAANWINHLEYDWESPLVRHLLVGLSQDRTLIRYDARGAGLSDWDVADLSLEAWVNDLEVVADAAGVERFPLLGISQGCAVSIAFAVTHPERVSHLILYGGFARGAGKRSPQEAAKAQALATLTRLQWGSENPAIRRMFATEIMPECTKEQMDMFTELQRRATSAESAGRYMEAVAEFDIAALLPKLEVPTLVMHARSDARIPIELGRELAAGIRGAKFVAMQGNNHWLLENDPLTRRFLEEISLFLTEPRRRP